MNVEPWLAERILKGRETKARRFARALWDAWTAEERAGGGVKKLAAEPPKFWKELAASIGQKHPSVFTIELVIEKLRVATTKTRGKAHD